MSVLRQRTAIVILQSQVGRAYGFGALSLLFQTSRCTSSATRLRKRVRQSPLLGLLRGLAAGQAIAGAHAFAPPWFALLDTTQTWILQPAAEALLRRLQAQSSGKPRRGSSTSQKCGRNRKASTPLGSVPWHNRMSQCSSWNLTLIIHPCVCAQDMEGAPDAPILLNPFRTGGGFCSCLNRCAMCQA